MAVPRMKIVNREKRSDDFKMMVSCFGVFFFTTDERDGFAGVRIACQMQHGGKLMICLKSTVLIFAFPPTDRSKLNVVTDERSGHHIFLQRYLSPGANRWARMGKYKICHKFC